MIRLLAVDIDGTLLDSKSQLPPRNAEALLAAHRAGIEVVLVTGRRHPFAMPIAEQIPFDLVLITSNGAVIKSRSGQTFLRHLLPLEVARQAIEWTAAWRRYTMLAFDVEGRGQIVMESLESRTPGFASWYERNKQYVEFQPLEAALNQDPLQVMYGGPLGPMQEIAQALDRAPFRKTFQLTKTFYESRDLGIMDLIHSSCSKGAALAEWAARQGVPRNQVMAVGDNFNDLEMLEFAGLPVVMGNAVPELKADGWRVTLDNDSAGLAVAIEQWALPCAQSSS
jgi:Cof subfamily protein (haloacid dehalogenase superfamily)